MTSGRYGAEDVVLYERGQYQVCARLWDDGSGGEVRVYRGDQWAEAAHEGGGIGWLFRYPPGWWWWQRSVQAATLKAIAWIQRRVAREMENQANVEVLREVVAELPELLS